MSSDPTARETSPVVEAYVPPAVSDLGSLSDLTMGGDGFAADASGPSVSGSA